MATALRVAAMTSVVLASATVSACTAPAPASTQPAPTRAPGTPGESADLPLPTQAAPQQLVDVGMRAMTLGEIPAFVAPGQAMTDMFGENQEFIPRDALVYILAEDDGWLNVHVTASGSWWPNDYFAWMPKVHEERPSVQLIEPVQCPDGNVDVAAVASFAAPDRLHCFGDRVLALNGFVTGAIESRGYLVTPAWFGGAEEHDRTVSIGIDRGHEARFDIQLLPNIQRPPMHFTVNVTGSFDHPDALTCKRTPHRPAGLNAPPWAGLPHEPPELSSLWCRQRFVVSSLEVAAGPEGRPAVLGDVQLHRFPANNVACGGVGMPMMNFRIDVTQLDAVWLETVNGDRVLPYWGPGFMFEGEPDPVIRDADGSVVARDGQPFDPDRALHGHAVCPTGDIVYIGP